MKGSLLILYWRAVRTLLQATIEVLAVRQRQPSIASRSEKAVFARLNLLVTVVLTGGQMHFVELSFEL